MKTLLKLNKLLLVAIAVIVSLCLQGNYSYSQGLGGLRDKVKKAKDDVKKTTDDAKQIKTDAKGQVDEVKKVTGTDGTGIGSAITGTSISNEKFYRITNLSTGQELALTLVYSTDKALHKAIYEATIELKPIITANDAQEWILYHPDRSATDDIEVVYSKVGWENGNGYTVWLNRPDSSNNPDDRINSLKMYLNQSTYESTWHFKKLSNGYYRILNELAMPDRINKRFEEQKDRWNEERCLQVINIGGKLKLKQMKTADIDAQYWKLTELEYIPVNR